MLLALGLFTASCSSNTDEESITLYSGRDDDFMDSLIEEFEEETGIEVAVRYGESADLANLINEEGDKTPADVFLSQSPGAIGFLEQNNRIEKLPDETLNLVPETVRDTEGLWVGITGRQRVLVYNKEIVNESDLPEKITEITEEQWRGKIGVAPSNGSFQDFVTAMRASLGEKETESWLKALAANDPITFADNKSIVAAVGRGEVEAGLVNHYYNYQTLKENPDHPGLNSQFEEKDPGSVLIVTAATKLKSEKSTTKKNENANAFIEWLLEEEAQRDFADNKLEYPLANDISPNEAIPETDFTDLNGINYEDLGTGLKQTQKMIEDSGL